jgi:hypothetical protein
LGAVDAGVIDAKDLFRRRMHHMLPVISDSASRFAELEPMFELGLSAHPVSIAGWRVTCRAFQGTLSAMGADAQLPDLTYCLSIHGGETAAEVLQGIAQGAGPVRDELLRRGVLHAASRFPLGLRVSARAARALAGEAGIRRLREILRRNRMRVVTLNLFPYGPFHGPGIKESVYLPDWRSPHRTEYTLCGARLLAKLLPADGEGSLSTVPVAYGRLGRDGWRRAASEIGAAVAGLARMRARTGRLLGLALEPEPDCVLESSEDAAEALEKRLFPAAERAIGGRGAEAAARLHLGVCLDTCHHAVIGESPSSAWARYDRAGIRVWKVQISSALRLPANPAYRTLLEPFADAVYLHQTVAFRAGKRVRRWPDLPAALRDPGAGRAEELLVHCHVPLGWRGGRGLGTTRGALTPAFFRRLARGDCPHAEVETYTFQVLPKACQGRGMTHSLAGELAWVHARMRSARDGSAGALDVRRAAEAR